MQHFFLNLTRIVEKNPRIYLSIIFGIAFCLMLFVVEAVHMQKMVEALNTQNQDQLRAVMHPITDRYFWSRIFVLFLMCIWSNYEYRKAKKMLGL